MKILKQGVKPEYVWRGYCNCGCVFQLEKNDKRNIESDRDCNAYFKCPCCGKTVKLSWEDIRESDETIKDGEQDATY